MRRILAILAAFTIVQSAEAAAIRQLEKATGIQTNASTIDEALRVYAMRSTGR